RAVGTQRGLRRPGARLSCRLAGSNFLPRRAGPCRCRGRYSPRQAQRGWRRHRAWPSRGRERQPHRAASGQCDEAVGGQTRHRHRMQRGRTRRRHADRDGLEGPMGKTLEVLKPRDLELGPAAGSGPWRHWRLTRDENGIAWLLLDKAGAKVNTLSEEVVAELNDVLEQLERELPKGVVLRSAKPNGFIAGADIAEFRGMADAAAVEARLKEAHGVVDRLDRLKAPTVAVVHGYCLG